MRAAASAFDPEGDDGRIFATGVRNCPEPAVQPVTGDLFCATNERDGLGDNLPPDNATRVRTGRLYGSPWYYIGDNKDPQHVGARPGLSGQVTVPDVLIQAHLAPRGITFYESTAFPDAYRGDVFVALHGLWNRADRTGYKVVRLVMKDGKPTGKYQDFMTGFVVDSGSAWERPDGVAVTRDGVLPVSEDGNGSMWRVTPVP